MKNRLEEDKRLVRVVPSARQIAYQEMEFFCFIHFTVNTFTGSTIGYKRIIDLNKIKTTKLVIDICDSRVAPVISFVGVY